MHRLPPVMSRGRKEVPEQQTLEMDGESQRKHERSPLKASKATMHEGMRGDMAVPAFGPVSWCGDGKVHLRGVTVNGIAPGLQRLYLGEGTLWVVPGRGDKGTSQCQGHPSACAWRGQSPCAPPSPSPMDGSKINPHVKYNHLYYLGSNRG